MACHLLAFEVSSGNTEKLFIPFVCVRVLTLWYSCVSYTHYNIYVQKIVISVTL